MTVQTTRFGSVKIMAEDFIEFREGILGFADLRKFVLLDDPNDEIFAWLQSCELPEIAFPVLEPELFTTSYRVVLNKHDLESLQLPLSSGQTLEGTRLFSIITIPDDPTQMTANLKAPVIINVKERIARQVVLQDNNLAIREPIFSRLQSRIVQNPRGSIKSQASDWGVAIKLPERGTPEVGV